jgi:hypothetical protein
MDANLRTRIERALLKACPDDPTARINLEDVPPDKIAGYVLSTTFEKWSPSERQELIWKELDDSLSAAERTRIVFIVTDTPDEFEAIRNAATG